jgi:hypothetical protein
MVALSSADIDIRSKARKQEQKNAYIFFLVGNGGLERYGGKQQIMLM